MLEQHGSSRSSRLARQSRTCRVESSQVEFGLNLASIVTIPAFLLPWLLIYACTWCDVTRKNYNNNATCLTPRSVWSTTWKSVLFGIGYSVFKPLSKIRRTSKLLKSWYCSRVHDYWKVAPAMQLAPVITRIICLTYLCHSRWVSPPHGSTRLWFPFRRFHTLRKSPILDPSLSLRYFHEFLRNSLFVVISFLHCRMKYWPINLHSGRLVRPQLLYLVYS